jgi:hippurate hydrolase
MGAEDFSYVLEQAPGAMLFLGAAHRDVDAAHANGIHSPRMVLDEEVLPRGSALLAGLGQAFLERGFASKRANPDPIARKLWGYCLGNLRKLP